MGGRLKNGFDSSGIGSGSGLEDGAAAALDLIRSVGQARWVLIQQV